METTRGKLLVSTKSMAAGRKAVVGVCSALLMLFGIVGLTFVDLFPRIARNLFGNASLSWVIVMFIVIGFFVFPIIELVILFLGSKSYCDVYENAVVGTTSMSVNNPKAPMQNFEITYDEIQNVTESGKALIIYTQYTTYEVLALKNRPEALKAIRAKMTSNK